MLIPIVLLIVTLFGIPAYLIYLMWMADEKSKYDWLVRVLHHGGIIIFLVLIGRWDWFGYYLRYVWVALFVFAAFRAYLKVTKEPRFSGEGRQRWIKSPLMMLELVLVAGALVYVLTGYYHSDDAVNLDFPLDDGHYYIAHGGTNFIVNNHSSNRAQHYALDIAELNSAGMRANGIYPDDLGRYVIFDAPIYSPCDGTISEAVDGLPDHIPPDTDTENVAGNHVVIDCRDVRVLLAHMREGSVLVEAGDRVTSGQALGRVGNSGNTSEPHLHIHAVESGDDVLDGDAVPLRFDGEFPIRNDLIFGR